MPKTKNAFYLFVSVPLLVVSAHLFVAASNITVLLILC
jgi:hypothetical protein